MHERMERLETILLYQQKMVEDLNAVVTAQQTELLELRQMVLLLGRKIQAQGQGEPFDPEELPPHY